MIDDAVKYAKEQGGDLKSQVDLALDKVAVNFGVEILKIVPGRVSTELDARLSFDTEATIKKAHQIIKLYKEAGSLKFFQLLDDFFFFWQSFRH